MWYSRWPVRAWRPPRKVGTKKTNIRSSVYSFAKAATLLETQQEQLGIDFTFNCTTLEKVFLNISYQADLVAKANQTNIDMSPQLVRTTSLENIYNGEKNLVANGFEKDYSNTKAKVRASKWYEQIGPLMKKRAIHYYRDRKAVMCTFVLPTIMIFIAMALTLLRPPTLDDPAVQLTPEMYEPNTHFLR